MNTRTLRIKFVFLAACLVLPGGLVCTGCAASKSTGAGSLSSNAEQGPSESERLTREAIAVIATDKARAEALLKKAVAADPYNGQAHNNLGALYLDKGQLYEAAASFELARKLIPGHADPRLNLALTFEKAGRTDEALAMYTTALEVYPGHIPTMQAMARLQLRAGRADDKTASMLEEVALRGETKDWREWAQFQRARMGP